MTIAFNLPWIFPEALLIFNGAPWIIQGILGRYGRLKRAKFWNNKMTSPLRVSSGASIANNLWKWERDTKNTLHYLHSQIARFMELTWGLPGSCWSQVGPILAPWTFLSWYYVMTQYTLPLSLVSLRKSACLPLWSTDNNILQRTWNMRLCITYQCPGARLRYPQCVGRGDTTDLH